VSRNPGPELPECSAARALSNLRRVECQWPLAVSTSMQVAQASGTAVSQVCRRQQERSDSLLKTVPGRANVTTIESLTTLSAWLRVSRCAPCIDGGGMARRWCIPGEGPRKSS